MTTRPTQTCQRYLMIILAIGLFTCLFHTTALAQTPDPVNTTPPKVAEIEQTKTTEKIKPTEESKKTEQEIEHPWYSQKSINATFGKVNKAIEPVLFFDISFGAFYSETIDSKGKKKEIGTKVPLMVVFLMGGAIFFTFRFGFVNLRMLGHCVQVIRGKYDDPDDHGEVSHFQALTSALSATLGLGNIAMVAVAISQGGPGAIFWMWVIAFFGMSSKFSSCSLGQLYRRIGREGKHDEHVLGGPMIYLEKGIPEMLGGGILSRIFGKTLGISFAIFAIGGALGGGNMFQSNQTFEIVSNTFMNGDKSYAWLVGMILAALVGLVIVGGIKRIGEVTCKLVPAMCIFYCTVCLAIIFSNFGKVPGMFADIFAQAFNFQAAGWGGATGLLTVFVVGAKRAAFSNEAGLGSAAIAHSAAKTKEPIREGIVAMIGPFIDTIIVCTMTALAILSTGVHEKFSGGSMAVGVSITTEAFRSFHGWLPYLLCLAVFVFAYSTMISWCYYGERAVEYLGGKKAILPYRVIYVLFVMLGPMLSLSNVLNFTDLLILSMAYPNILGMIILSPKIAKLSKDYIHRLKTGQIKPYKKPEQDPAAEI